MTVYEKLSLLYKLFLQAMFMLILLGWVFLPVYMASGVSKQIITIIYNTFLSLWQHLTYL